MKKALEKPKNNSSLFKKTVCPFCGSGHYETLFSKLDTDHPYLLKHIKQPLTFTVVRCSRCGLQYMNPTLTEVALKKLYIKEYIDYTNTELMTLPERAGMLDANLKRMQFIIKKTQIRQGKLLDYGCGLGNFIKQNKDRFRSWKFIGYDFNAELGTDRHYQLHYGPSIAMTKIPHRYFDVVIMIEVIEHLIDMDRYFKELDAYTKNGSYLFIETGNCESLITRIIGKKNFYYSIYHTIYFSRRTIKKVLAKYGYRVVYIGDHIYNDDLLYVKHEFNLLKCIRGLIYTILKPFKIGNFSITGGMCVIAQKIR
jgi:2-polyprenyl-3-methyl-5-hydroxy-6-metoxy-1,4-benzoquinol methylase